MEENEAAEGKMQAYRDEYQEEALSNHVSWLDSCRYPQLATLWSQAQLCVLEKCHNVSYAY